MRVKDFTDTSYHQTGKQRIKRGGIWYTPQSGIWQTVWLESVPKHHIQSLKLTSLYDDQQIKVELDKVGTGLVHVEVYYKDELEGSIDSDQDEIIVTIKNLHASTTETPRLYDIKNTRSQHQVDNYIEMRHIERKKQYQVI